MTKKRTPGIARIAALIGGTCAEMARFVKSLCADVVLWIDVLSELEKVNAAPGVIRLILAPGQTLASLFEGLPDSEHLKAIRQYLKSRPGVDLITGLGQSRFAGVRAAQMLVTTPEFRAVLQDIYSQIMILHNGTIEKVEIELNSSGSGGTGGPAGGPIIAELARYYREHHRAVVHVRFNRAGSLSFEGLGEAVHDNNAANVLADLTYTLLDPRPLEEVRSMNFYELPMVVKDKNGRDRYMATFLQALNSSEYRALRDVSAPNKAAHSHLGSISLMDVAWWRDLGAARVRLNVAARFGSELRQVLATEPARNVLERIEVETKPLAPVTETTLPQLVERLHQSKRKEPPGLLDAVENITSQFSSITVYAHCRMTGRAAFQHSWRERCRIPCRTVAEFSDRLAFLRALAQAVEVEIAARANKIATLQRDRRQTRTEMSVVKDEYYPQTVTGKLANLLFADSLMRGRDDKFRALATTSREKKLAVDKLDAENKALHLCGEELQKEIEANEKRIRSVLRMLSSEDAQDWADEQVDLVEIGDIDSVLQDLLQMADAAEIDDQKLENTLLGCAKRVTLAGLASITCAHEPRVDAIAAKLTQQPPTVGPFWGGKRPMSVDSTVFVLPPVASELRGKLEAAFAPLVHHSDKHQLVFSDTAEAGFNVVRLQIRQPKTYGEIVTPQIIDQFQKISAKPALYFQEGYDIDRATQLLNGHYREPTAVGH